MADPLNPTPDDVRRVADFAQEEAAHQDEEADDVESGPDRWADATDDDFDAAREEAEEIREDGHRVTHVAALIHERADEVAAILAADESKLYQVRLLLGIPFPTEPA